MSDAFRKAMANKLPQLPRTKAPWAEEADEGQEELQEEEEEDGLGNLHAALPPPTKYGSTDLTPLSASSFFQQALEVTPSSSSTTFRVYLTPPNASNGKGKGTYLVCHHGAGASGLSFAALAKHVRESSHGELGVLAFDCRNHGKTSTAGPSSSEQDLSLPTLQNDFLALIQHIFPDAKESPSLILLGHSMGAAPILSSAPTLQKKGYTIPGVIVLDVVEGTAIEALPLMKSILSQRPTQFRSVVDAIHWHLTSNTLRDTEAARVSVPSFLIPDPSNSNNGGGGGEKQIWRTDLLATEPYWEEWYIGLSKRFLEAKCARLLVLAGQERLDKELMVGQMQGKFQLEVMPDTGHYLHEDNPSSLASTIVQFWRRNTRVLVLPPKIGQPGVPGMKPNNIVKRVGED
ncbi:protein phosphatase methylesterase 1 [Kwoniella mangroviensis CBS 10435]|uniref:Protein phosphatase methylesterase 1 n=1 Tax=Kwoniella mangroviensis CBS 10435 TaxID=1331196 RepID=A0A1B9J017_9TREE|nr:protein phosphatase methylesterase 1 [Kwoniella mangroviensis CBS 10435]